MAVEVNSGDFGEESTGLFTLNFFDEANNPITPDEVKWTLTDTDGNVINSRVDQVATPGNPTYILLSGADLALQSDTDDGNRVLTIKAKYTSARGTGLPLNEEITFRIRKYLNVS